MFLHRGDATELLAHKNMNFLPRPGSTSPLCPSAEKGWNKLHVIPSLLLEEYSGGTGGEGDGIEPTQTCDHSTSWCFLDA